MYDNYKIARNLSWKVLKECGIKSLPVNLQIIASYYGVEIILYSEYPLLKYLSPKVRNGDGFAVEINGKPVIFLNDRIANRGRRRFTMGHELGHILLGHPLEPIKFRNSEDDNPNDPLEVQANVFSRDILAPACVLKGLGVSTPDEIIKTCDISQRSAEIRAERLEKLLERDKFFYHPLERQVYIQFEPYIEAKKAVLN